MNNRRNPVLIATFALLALALQSGPAMPARSEPPDVASSPAAANVIGKDAQVDDPRDAETPGRQAAIPAGASVLRDLAYGPESEQRVDVYLPARAKAAPVIFMVHGGGWMFGDKANAAVTANKLVRWLPQGFVVVSVNYRLLPRTSPLEQANDVARALAFVQSRAVTWGADPERFIVIGHSSGSHLVSLLAADPRIAERQGATQWLGTVALDSAALDVVQVMEGTHPRFYDRVFGNAAQAWRDASPIHRLRANAGPLLLVCSTRRVDSCPQARAFADRAQSLGGRATVLPVGMSHGEINQKLGLPSAYTEAVEAFMRSAGVR